MNEDSKKQFLGAAQILHEFDHPNIVKCLGIAMDYEPVIVVMDYMKGICMPIENVICFIRKIAILKKSRIHVDAP